MCQSFLPLALVFIGVAKCHRAFSMREPIFPLSLINIFVSENVLSVSISLPVGKLALVNLWIWPDVHTLFELPLLYFPKIHVSRFPVALNIWLILPNAHSFLSIFLNQFLDNIRIFHHLIHMFRMHKFYEILYIFSQPRTSFCFHVQR